MIELYLSLLYKFVLIAGIFGLAAGALLIFSPGTIKKISAFLDANLNLLEKLAKIVDSSPGKLDDWLMVKPKLAGFIIVLVSVFLIFNSAKILFVK